MRIEDVTLEPVILPLARPVTFALGTISSLGCLLVTVRGGGLQGESVLFTLNGVRLRVLQEMVESLRPLVIGAKADHPTAIWEAGWRSINFVGHEGISIFGLSAIDSAIWDLKARAAGVSVARMLAIAHEKLPTYHSGGLWLSTPVEELGDEAEQLLGEGFDAIKLRLGAGTVAQDRARCDAVRRAVGPDVKLLVDYNQGLEQAEAIRRARALEEYDLTWLEEPLPAWDYEGLARVRKRSPVAIAAGETIYTRHAFRRLLELRAIDVAMPDLQRVGGVTEFMRVAHLAHAFDAKVSSHLFPEMSIQILAALGNASYLEYVPWLAPLYGERLEISGGMVAVPDRPGWGFTFDRDFVAHLKRGS